MITGQEPGQAPALSGGATWQWQYLRMLRSFRRLVALAQGERFGDDPDSEEATDALVHFFQDAYHLKDWIKNDEEVTIATVRREIERDLFGEQGPLVMRLCADMCNGAKHHTLNDRRRFGMSGIASEHVIVRPAAAGSGAPAQPPLHSWTLFADEQELDALTMAHDVVDEWETWLFGRGLVRPIRR